AVVHRSEEPAPAVLLGPEARGVGAPHLVRAVGADGPAVRRVSSRVLAPHRGQEAVLPHDAKHPVLAHAEALLPKMGPHLPVPLTPSPNWSGHLGEVMLNLFEEEENGGISQGRRWAPAVHDRLQEGAGR